MVFWTFIDVLINKGSFFFATIVLANVLGPKEFGLLGMIMLFVSIGNTLVDGGISTSLIRTNQVTEKNMLPFYYQYNNEYNCLYYIVF